MCLHLHSYFTTRWQSFVFHKGNKNIIRNIFLLFPYDNEKNNKILSNSVLFTFDLHYYIINDNMKNVLISFL